MREAITLDSEYQDQVKSVRESRSVRWEVRSDRLLQDGGRGILIPNHSVLRTKIILEAHEPPFVSHFGVKKTAELVART